METRDVLFEALDDLKKAVQRDIAQHVKNFELKTGLTPADIEVNMVDVSSHDSIRRSVVGSVKIDLGSF